MTLNTLIYKSLGIEHLAIAHAETKKLLELDISHNDIGS